MEKLLRVVRFFIIIILIVLATIGIGITGVAPNFSQHKRNNNAVKIELMEDNARQKKGNQTAEIK
ncbi:MAG: hypothetical protein ACK4TA_14030 [Saprospiraceae bacterium]